MTAILLEEVGPGGEIGTDYTISQVYPEEGATIFKTTVLALDVTNFDWRIKIELQCDQGLTREVVHDGTNFLAPYLKSVRFPVAGGWEYQLRRTSGWVNPPTVYVVLRVN